MKGKYNMIYIQIRHITQKDHSNYVNSVKFSKNGKFIVSGSFDMTAKVWNATTY